MVIVEDRRNGDDLASPMPQMRTWSDDQRINGPGHHRVPGAGRRPAR